ncbi:MAG: hypothetical protein SOT06_04440, partial [Eubacteriales bacterium]|nr:hypothetical protein [Eubacteriales bacterium]
GITLTKYNIDYPKTKTLLKFYKVSFDSNALLATDNIQHSNLQNARNNINFSFQQKQLSASEI